MKTGTTNSFGVDNPKSSKTDLRRSGFSILRLSSIRSRLLALALGLTMIAIIVIALVAFSSASDMISQAQKTSSQSLRTQAEVYLQQINSSLAAQNNLVLDRAARDVQAVADTTAAIFNSAGAGQPLALRGEAQHLVRGPDGQYLNKKEDTSSVFIPNTVLKPESNQDVLRDVELSAYLDLTLPSIKNNNPNAAAIYLGTVNDLTRYYPNIMLGEVVPADFQVTGRPWYLTALDLNKDLSSPVPAWSSVYQDATGLGLVTTIAVPVYEQTGQLVGVVGLDLTLDEISKNIGTSRFLNSGYSFLVDKEGKAIILPEQGYRDILGRAPEPQEFGPDLKSVPNTTFSQIIERMTRAETGFAIATVAPAQPSDNSSGEVVLPRELFVAFSPLESTGWSLGSIVAAEDVLQSVVALEQELRASTRNVLFNRVLPLGAAISIILILLAFFLTDRLVNPIQKLTEAAEQIGSRGSGDVHFPFLAKIFTRNDEIGFLARTLNNMAAQISESFEKLEGRVAERTQQLERRTLQIQTAAEIASDITTAKDLDSMLQSAVNLISARFGYYNVGIFLVDEIREYAQLKAASGELGKLLLEKKIKLRVGQEAGASIVGYVTRFGQVRVVADVRTEKMYAAEPILADTRSEATIPLLVGGHAQDSLQPRISSSETSTGAPRYSVPQAVIGALDIQSTQENAFTQDDITVLQILADQLAIAIQNIRLVNQLQTTLQELTLFYQGQTRDAWSRFADQSAGLAYVYDQLDVRPTAQSPVVTWQQADITDEDSPSQNSSLQPSSDSDLSGSLAIPIRLREQVIGVIGLESDDPNHYWTDDEIAILQATAAQAALTVENARLLAETQRKALREQMAGEITARIRASLDMETVLQTAMREIAQRLGIQRMEIQLGSNLAASGDEDIPQDLPAPKRTLGELQPPGDGQHD